MCEFVVVVNVKLVARWICVCGPIRFFFWQLPREKRHVYL